MKAIDIDPKNFDALLSAGNLQNKNRSPDIAITHFTEALRIDAKDYRIYFGLCTGYTQKGWLTKAIGLCKNALDLKPDDVFVLNRLAWLYAKKSVNLDKGIEISLHTLELKPNTPEFIDTLSELYYKKGDTKKAIETINRAIKLDPSNGYYKQQRRRFSGV
jgi:tetratricopeptide (TPR) repeat protein